MEAERAAGALAAAGPHHLAVVPRAAGRRAGHGILAHVKGWAASPIDRIPTVPEGDADDPHWHPVQHFFGLTTFGANVFVAPGGDETLVAAHDERASGQQELYVVLEGAAEVRLADDVVHAVRGTAIAVTDPAVKRSAAATAPGTALLVIGAGDAPFSTTWNASHFADVPRADLG
jgi:hypothetical protein